MKKTLKAIAKISLRALKIIAIIALIILGICIFPALVKIIALLAILCAGIALGIYAIAGKIFHFEIISGLICLLISVLIILGTRGLFYEWFM